MAILRIVQPPMLTAEVYDALNARMGVDEEPPEGLLMNCAPAPSATVYELHYLVRPRV